MSHLLTSDRGVTHVDPHDTYYIINPSGDLPRTEKTFASWFSGVPGWKGVVNMVPRPDEFVEGLEHHDTLM